MIRFMPDSWSDALLRPLTMAAPNGWVYVEIMAPDIRFVLALGLAVLVAIGVRKYQNTPWLPVLALFCLTFLSFVPWMVTTGNGRYFIPYLVLIGPLCIGLIHMLPYTQGMKVTMVLLVLVLQGFSLYQNNPWKPFVTWGATPWRDAPYYSIDLDPKAIEPDATYITVSSQTMSLLAPQFPATSRWVNLSVFDGLDANTLKQSVTYAPVQKILQSSPSLKLFHRSAPNQTLPGSDQPNQATVDEVNTYLGSHHLALTTPTDCKLFASRSPGYATVEVKSEETPGFWICSLQYPIAPAPKARLTALEIRAIKVFEKMEALCPRFFPPGQTIVKNHLTEHSRTYFGNDTMLILKHNGDLYVKNTLALDPEKIGQADEVLCDHFRIDCTKFKGRTRLPWEREI